MVYLEHKISDFLKWTFIDVYYISKLNTSNINKKILCLINDAY